MSAPRSPETVNRRRRTAAATMAVRRRRAEKLALDLAPRVPLLEDMWVQALAFVVVSEVRRRGLQLPVEDL